MVPSDQTSAPATAYATPSRTRAPDSAPALTTTMPAKPTQEPDDLQPVRDSPSNGAASTPVSTGCR